MRNKKINIVDNGDGSKSALVEVKTSYDNLATGSFTQRTSSSIEDVYNMSLLGGNNGFRISSGTEYSTKSKIRKTLFYWENEPIVYKCITLLAQLSNDTFTISCEDKKIESALRAWWVNIKGSDFLDHFFLEYFRSGNVPILRTNVTYVPKNGFKKEGFERKIPGGYTILNPLNVTLKDSGFPGIKEAHLVVSTDFLSLLKNSQVMERVKNVFPEEIASKIEPGCGEINLPREIFSMVTKDKQPYESWATPLTSHAFDALDYKRSLMEMDSATVTGVRNRILKVTIGNDTFPVTDTKELIALANKFKNPSKNLTIFWNHTLNIEYIEPNLESLNKDKYEPVVDDIRTVYGISKVLLGSDGDSSGNNTLCLKGMIEILEQARSNFISWFIREINDVANIISNTREDGVSVSFGTLNLKDENDFFRVIMQMVDRQIISYETASETLGYYFPKELNRLEKEKKIRDDKGILVAQKAPTQGGGNNQVDTQNTGGRPKGGDKEVQRKESQDKPKTPSGIKTVSEIINNLEIACASSMEPEDIKNMLKREVGKKEIDESKILFINGLIDSSDSFTDVTKAREFASNLLEMIV